MEPAAAIGRREDPPDHLSFIESIGLYWINPATGQHSSSSGGPWISDQLATSHQQESSSSSSSSQEDDSDHLAHPRPEPAAELVQLPADLRGSEVAEQQPEASSSCSTPITCCDPMRSSEEEEREILMRLCVGDSGKEENIISSSNQIEELDFLSMLGLTKVGGVGEAEASGGSGGGQAKKWRLWQPEVSRVPTRQSQM